jgi:hypothetical protein
MYLLINITFSLYTIINKLIVKIQINYLSNIKETIFIYYILCNSVICYYEQL